MPAEMRRQKDMWVMMDIIYRRKSRRFNHIDRGRLVSLVPERPRVCQIVAVKVLDKSKATALGCWLNNDVGGIFSDRKMGLGLRAFW